jgi:hypothetical protein
LDEAPLELIDALFETAKQYGLKVPTDRRIDVARTIAAAPNGSQTGATVDDAFARHGLARPPRGFGSAVIRSWRSSATPPSLMDLLLEYRQWAIDALSAEHGGKPKSEETLRNNLRAFIPKRAHVEARTGRGKTDIYIPELDAVIECKVWTDQSTFDAGVEELARYIRTSNPKLAFMVVFGDRHPLPKIVDDPDQAIGEPVALGGLTVPVVVITFEVDFPSTARADERRRAKRGSTR